MPRRRKSKVSERRRRKLKVLEQQRCKSKVSEQQRQAENHTTICEALNRNDVTLARSLVKQGYRLNPPTLRATTTPLHMAIKMCEITLVKMMLRGHASLEVKDAKQMTPLHVALECQNKDIAKMVLLKACERRNARFKQTQLMTQLHASCLIQDMYLIRKYLKEHIDVNDAISQHCPLYPSYTALHIAVQYNDESMVKLLLQYGADVRVFNSDGLTPLLLADHYSPDAIIHLLLQAHKKRFKYSVNPTAPSGVSHLHMACKYGHRASINGFIETHPQDLNNIIKSSKWATYPTALHCAVLLPGLIVWKLMKKGADLSIGNTIGQTALHFAYLMECTTAANLIMNYNAEFCPHVNPHDDRGISHLHIACSTSSIYRVIKLVEAGADINKSTHELANPAFRDTDSGRTPLLVAIQYNRDVIVKVLLHLGADVNKPNAAGITPLMKAATGNNLKILKLLLEAGADCEKRNLKGDTALLIAVKNPLMQCAYWFIEYGASVNCYDSTGKTPMYWACYYGKIKDVKALLKAGRDLKTRDSKGRTLMHRVMELRLSRNYGYIIQNYADLLEWLVKAGLDVNARDYDGNTPLHIAAKEGTVCAIIVLLGFGANMTLYNREGLLAIEVYTKEHVVNSGNTIIRCFAFYVVKFRYKRERCNPAAMERVLREIEKYQCGSSMKIVAEMFDKELDQMRSCQLDRYTTLYDVVFITASDMVVHLNNEKLSMLVNSPSFGTEYPVFAIDIKNTYQKATINAKVVKEAKTAISFLDHEHMLPVPCCEAILRHLNDEDMVAVIEAVKNPESENSST